MLTATLTFDNKYVEEGGRVIRNYVGRTEDNRLASYDYKSHFKRDHKLYNYYNNIINAEIRSSDIGHVSADEASNAISSASAFEMLTRKERTQDMDFDTCYAHQNQRSGGYYASGTWCDAGSWKKENTLDSLKCWNLERILDDQMKLTTSAEISLQDFEAETENGANGDGEEDVEILD